MMNGSFFSYPFFIGFIALVVKVSIPELLPYGSGHVVLDRPPFTSVDPNVRTFGHGNIIKIYERFSKEKRGHEDPLLVGPETVVIDYESNIYALAGDNIIQLKNLGREETKSDPSYPDSYPDTYPDRSKWGDNVFADVVIVAKSPGFLLGGKFVPNTKILYFADAVNGLCRIDLSKPNPKVELIASSFQLDNGTWSKITFADDVDIGPKSGIVYFSDASDILPERNSKHKKQFDLAITFKMDVMRGKKSGRLLKYDPSTNKVTVLANDIWFANGVAVDEEEEFVMLSESSMFRILKYHLKGHKKGQLEVMVDNLPGFPDGADCTKEQLCYSPLPSSIPPIFNILYKFSPSVDAWVRTLLMILPESLSPKHVPYGAVVEITQGNDTTPSQIKRLFQDPNGDHISFLTGVTEHGGKLYLGSLHNNFIGVLDLSKKS